MLAFSAAEKPTAANRGMVAAAMGGANGEPGWDGSPMAELVGCFWCCGDSAGGPAQQEVGCRGDPTSPAPD